LAQSGPARSAPAAKEIKTLIGDSVAQVPAGSNLVAQAGAAMDEVVASVKRVTDIMGKITAASREQCVGIEQVNLAIAQMDQVTQQNAQLVEHAAAAARSLQDQTVELAAVVSIFTLGANESRPAPKPLMQVTEPQLWSGKPLQKILPLTKTAVASIKNSESDAWELTR
jgi:Methyl-accepting chemotaxis protein (MCP) signalling domain